MNLARLASFASYSDIHDMGQQLPNFTPHTSPLDCWVYRSTRRWQNRGELLLRGVNRFWRLYLPLVMDLCPLVFVWIILPAKFDAPMEVIVLFVPNVFVVIVIY